MSILNKTVLPWNFVLSTRTSVSLLAFLLAFNVCSIERNTIVSVEGGNPPIFRLKGSGRQDFLLVRELSDKEIADPSIRPVETDVLWELRPKGPTQPPADSWPAITYGTVPADFIQTTPAVGKPNPLVEGKAYEAGGSASSANGGSVWFKIENGQAKEIPRRNP